MRAIILADVGPLGTAAWEALERYVRAGGALVIVPGAKTLPETYPVGGPLLPAAMEEAVDCPEPLALAASDMTHPYLKPFADGDVDSINDRRAFKRLRLGLLSQGAGLIIPFADHKPALVERRVDEGRVVLFAFSPARQWGQFGSQAGPMIVLLHAILENCAPKATDMGSLVAGRVVRHSVGDLEAASLLLSALTVGGLGETRSETLAVENGQVTLPTEPPGTYRLLAASPPRQPVFHYSVNVAETESDLSRVDPSAITGQFREGLVVLTDAPGSLDRVQRPGRQELKWLVPLALALLGLLFIESLFANRFYVSRDDNLPSS